MSKNLGQISSYVMRKARIDSSDTISVAAITEDANDAIGIIASLKNWDELYKTLTLSLLKSDGDKNYPLDASVDKVELVRITLPVTYAKEITYIPRREILSILGAKSNNGTATPNQWYYSEPTLSSSNVETKNMSFDQMPDQAYTVAYTFRRYAPQLVNTTDYPFFDVNFHYLIGYYCIWQYAERNPDETMNPDSWERKWNKGLNTFMSAYNSKVTVNSPIPGPNMNTNGYE